MPRIFDIPTSYRSPIISVVKHARQVVDPRQRDLSPSVLDFGPVCFKIARHFGFCYGVENAIEIAYRTLADNPHKRVFLLSEMVHNPHVNEDLCQRGVQFLCDTSGKQLIPFDALTPDDVVIVPAFGTTLEIQAALQQQGANSSAYNSTCPFVEKVWRKSRDLGLQGYTIVIHGKRSHEETRATFSHAAAVTPVVVVYDLAEAHHLAQVIRGEASRAFFFAMFVDRYSPGFDPDLHLQRIGVVNQTTMLATETEAITEVLRDAMLNRYDAPSLDTHFADTKDTLCYATKENQDATLTLIAARADLAVVVGGYNSSNTSHLVELSAQQMPTYFVCNADELISPTRIHHLDVRTHTRGETLDWLPARNPDGLPIEIALTAGASSPDASLEAVLLKILSWFPGACSLEAALAPYRLMIEKPMGS